MSYERDLRPLCWVLYVGLEGKGPMLSWEAGCSQVEMKPVVFALWYGIE